MSFNSGSAGPDTYYRWPVQSDQAVRRYGQPRPNPVAFMLLLLAGGCGVAQYLVAGFPVGQAQPVGGSVLSGRQLLWFLNAHTGDANAAASVTRIAIVVTSVGGAALLLLALATLLPINHRPLGAVALFLSFATVAAAIWTVTQANAVLGSPAAELFSAEHLGWYLMAGAAAIGVFGSVQALGDR